MKDLPRILLELSRLDAERRLLSDSSPAEAKHRLLRDYQATWSQLYHAVWPVVFGVAFTVLAGSRQDAEEAAHEALARVATRKSVPLTNTKIFMAYLMQTCRHEAVNQCRKRLKNLASEAASARVANWRFQTRELEALDVDTLRGVLDGLTADQLELLVLASHGMSLRQIAARQESLPGTLGVRLHRLRRLLRKRLDKP